MPRAVVTTEDKKRFELKTLPPSEGEEGGFVVIRRMPYGEYLTRREMATAMTMKDSGKGDAEATIKAANASVTEMEFAKCIVEHNLEDANSKLLDFRGNVKVAMAMLDPRIGDEISTYIDEMNNFEAALKKLNPDSTTSSSVGEPQTSAIPSSTQSE